MNRTMSVGLLAMSLVVAGCSSTATPSTTAPVVVSSSTTTSSTLMTAAPTTTAPAPATTTTILEEEGPAGWDSWTLIYASLETSTHTQADASAIAATIPDGAVLKSDDYPSLNPGYWVVYAGEWGKRRQAGLWCPRPLDPSLSCYPRYLGPDVVDLLDAGAAVAQLNEKLVLLDTEDGEVLATLDNFFHAEAEYPYRFLVDRSTTEPALYFGTFVEDSWFSCESSVGSIYRHNLITGIGEVFANGWSPTVSPDGRWLAVVQAAECLPDPEGVDFVVTPGAQIVVFDLASGSSSPSQTIKTSGLPTGYQDPLEVRDVFWESDGVLLVALGDNTVRSVALGSGNFIDDAPVAFETQDLALAAVTQDSFFFTSVAGDESILLTQVDRATDETSMREFYGYWASVAANSHGEVLIAASSVLILPSGEEIEIEGDIINIDW